MDNRCDRAGGTGADEQRGSEVQVEALSSHENGEVGVLGQRWRGAELLRRQSKVKYNRLARPYRCLLVRATFLMIRR